MTWQKGQSGNYNGRPRTGRTGCGETISVYVSRSTAARIRKLGSFTGKPYSRILVRWIEKHFDQLEDEVIMEVA